VRYSLKVVISSFLTLWYPFCVQVSTPDALDSLPHSLSPPLDWLDLEMKRYQGEHQCLQILDEVVEDAQAFGVLGFGNIDKGTNLGGL
jgi:hypothetical protein